MGWTHLSCRFYIQSSPLLKQVWLLTKRWQRRVSRIEVWYFGRRIPVSLSSTCLVKVLNRTVNKIINPKIRLSSRKVFLRSTWQVSLQALINRVRFCYWRIVWDKETRPWWSSQDRWGRFPNSIFVMDVLVLWCTDRNTKCRYSEAWRQTSLDDARWRDQLQFENRITYFWQDDVSHSDISLILSGFHHYTNHDSLGDLIRWSTIRNIRWTWPAVYWSYVSPKCIWDRFV